MSSLSDEKGMQGSRRKTDQGKARPSRYSNEREERRKGRDRRGEIEKRGEMMGKDL